MKRQRISACRLGAIAIMINGIVATIIAATITRLRPRISAMAPESGAEIAIASVVTVIVRLICAGVASNSRASEGSSDCGPYKLKNAQNPGMPTAARRKLWFMCERGSWPAHYRRTGAGMHYRARAAHAEGGAPLVKPGAH